MTTRVTVVMPAYNASRFINEAISSIRKQALTSWELIIINDGSTDDTGAIAERHAIEDRRIRVIHQVNAGQAAANNRAIPEARGEYIARMDADDISLPDRLSTLASYLDDHPDVVIVGSNAVLASAQGRDLQRTRLPERDEAIRSTLFTRRVNAFCNPSLLFRKAAWIACDGERSCFGHAHDLDLCLRMVERGPAHNLKAPTIRYRVHTAQVSTTASEMQATCALAAFLCADSRARGHEEPGYISSTAPISREALTATGVSDRKIDEAVISNLVGMHERLCLLGDLGAARSLRREAVARFARTSARARFAAGQCVMLYHEGKAAPSLAHRIAAWGAGARHLPAALPWLGPRLRDMA